MQKIVITGAGVVSAIGVGKEETLASLRAMKSGVGEVCYLQTEHHELPVGEVKMSNEELRAKVAVAADVDDELCRTTMMARLALREAMSEAHLLDDSFQLLPEYEGTMPLISGTTVAGMDRGETLFTSTEHEAMTQQMLALSSDCGSNTEQIARGFGAFAMLDTISTACSSAMNAIQLGANLLRTGRYDRVVVGGTESLSKFHLNGFNTLMILDQETCRPLDETRSGLNLGEGAAYLVLETAEAAAKRGVTPLAILSGYGNACDAFHQTASSEDGEGAYRAMTKALQMAGLQPSDIDYVNMHGTGTPNNDPSELAALHRLWGSKQPQFPLFEGGTLFPLYSSTKAFTGHTTSASGSIEAIFCLLALQHQFLPVSLNCNTPIAGEPAPVNAQTPFPEGGIRHILCNAFGFGGNDSALVISKAEELGMRDKLQSTNAVSEQDTKIYVIAENRLSASDENPDFKQYMTVGEARRLGTMLKRTLAVSLQTLRDAGTRQEDGTIVPFVPDAIITGTAWGNAESQETFLRDMLEGGEQLLKPTPFMQSTHNTIGSLIAISTHNHGYNNTHSQGNDSLQMALLDAVMLMQLGEVESALVGCHDALPEYSNHALLLVTEKALPAGVEPIRTLTL